jgi:hypothetical protein
MSVKSRVHKCLDEYVQSSLFSCYCVQLYAMVDKKSHPVEKKTYYNKNICLLRFNSCINTMYGKGKKRRGYTKNN